MEHLASDVIAFTASHKQFRQLSRKGQGDRPAPTGTTEMTIRTPFDPVAAAIFSAGALEASAAAGMEGNSS